MSNPDLAGHLKPLPEALRALPQVAPERSAWPQLAARLAAQANGGNAATATLPARRAALRRRFFIPATIAAGLVLAFGAAQLRHRPGARDEASAARATVAAASASYVANAANSANATNPQSSSTDADAGKLAALQQRSRDLEHWLQETTRVGAPLAGQDLAAATEIEDMIGLVDLQLGASARDSELPLWHRRVALLEDLTVLRYSSYSLAETGVAALTPAKLTN